MSFTSVLGSLIIQLPVWSVIVVSVLPYLIAIVMYFFLWLLNERSEKEKHSREMEVLAAKQAHELQLLETKKNTHN